MNCVAIFGVGLIGGSFALALRKAGFEGEILGVSSPRTIASALSMGVVNRGVDAEEAIETADLIYLAQPISTILATIDSLGSKFRSGTLITDVGSTKKQIVERACRRIQQALFVGGHPMAGKERSGVQEADANLFQDRTYVLSPVAAGDLERAQIVEFQSWIRRIGALPIVLDASEHDRRVAFTSHMPQLLSTSLASVLGDVEGAYAVAGPGVLELTRLALSPFSIWRDILTTNDSYIEEALSLLINKLREVKQELTSAGMEREFERAAKTARRLRERVPN